MKNQLKTWLKFGNTPNCEMKLGTALLFSAANAQWEANYVDGIYCFNNFTENSIKKIQNFNKIYKNFMDFYENFKVILEWSTFLSGTGTGLRRNVNLFWNGKKFWKISEKKIWRFSKKKLENFWKHIVDKWMVE